MKTDKRREIEKKVFFGLYCLIPIVSALYFFIDAIITGDWSQPRTYFAFVTCVLSVAGVFCGMAIPVVRVFKQDCMKTENRLFKAAIVLLILGAIGYLLTHAFFGWS